MRKMLYLQLLLLSILCKSIAEIALGLSWPTSSSTVKLLGLFPQQANEGSRNDMWTVHCRSMFRAAIVLSQQYNITFQGQFLSYEEIITDDDIMVTVDHICQKVSTSNTVGFVGPAYSSEARYLASFAHRLGILSVSYSATNPDLSIIDNGAFYRTVPSDEDTALSITILFKQYKWKSCIIIYQNDEYGYNGMKSLSEKFSKMNFRIQEMIKYNMKQQDFEVDLNKTFLHSFSRIVIVWANQKSTTRILNKALEENLIGADFVWILTTTITFDQFNPEQKQGLIGILTVEPVKADSFGVPINTTLLNQAYEIWKHYEPDTFPGENNVSSYALFTFDATWSLILSLQEFCSMRLSCLEFMNNSNCYNHQFLNSKEYYNIMKTMTFLGVSGEIKFSDGTPDRVNYGYYIIKNIQPLNIELNSIDYVPVLKWNIGSTNWTSYKNESSQIKWPNLSKKVPADHKLIRGQELRMVIMEQPPFIILKNSTAAYSGMVGSYKKINITQFDGFYKDIMSYLQNEMGFIPVVMLAKQTTQYNQLVEDVANGLFDTVMSTITITGKRMSMVDFSTALIACSFRVVTRKSKSVQVDLFFFVRIFSWKLWLVILFSMLIISILIWYFEKQNDRASNNRILAIGGGISYICCIIIGKVPFTSVLSNHARFLTYGLSIIQIILLALYTASLSSFLTIQYSDPILTGLDDIKNGKISPDRLGLVEGSAIEDFYLNTISQGNKNFYPLTAADEMYIRLMHNDIDAAVWNNLSLAYNTNNKYCDLMTVGVEFAHSSYSLPIKQDWLYKEDLNSNILSLIDTQELDRIFNKWFLQHSCKKADALDNKRKSIELERVGGVFIILNIIIIISIVINFWPTICSFGGKIIKMICQIVGICRASRVSKKVKWAQEGETVVGESGNGRALNQLNNPTGLCVDKDGNVYIVDSGNHRVVKWEYKTTDVQVVAGGNEPGNGTNQLHEPTDIIIYKEYLIICDTGNRRVVRWPRKKGGSGETILTNIACRGLAMDNQGFLYVSDTDKHQVRRYRIGEKRGRLVAGSNRFGNRLYQLNRPTYIFVDSDCSLYVSDSGNHRMIKWSKNAKEGIVVTSGQGCGDDLNQLFNPHGLIVDSSGNIYAADNTNHQVMHWYKEMAEESVIIGGNGQGSEANQLKNPQGLSIDDKGNLYVVDCGNHRVQRFNIEQS